MLNILNLEQFQIGFKKNVPIRGHLRKAIWFRNFKTGAVLLILIYLFF